MEIINNKTVKVLNSQELQTALEDNNEYEYIYLGNNITLNNGFTINENKTKITIDGTYETNRYTLTGIESSTSEDTIIANSNNKEIYIKNLDLVFFNIYGVINVPSQKDYSDVLTVYQNVNFSGTQLSYNKYGTTKIIDSTINIEDKSSFQPQEVCESNTIIIGGKTTITSTSSTNSLFSFLNELTQPTIIFLCQSDITLTTPKDLMNGTNKLNITILHDTQVHLTTGNGFGSNPVYGANNVLIDERASLTFIENSHQRVPMWTIHGSLTMKEDSTLEVINSYTGTPTDNYNIYFKGTKCKLNLDNPRSVIFYSKNANFVYTNSTMEYQIKCKRINLWIDSPELAEAGNINNLPDYSWYKKDDLLEINGTISSDNTTIDTHNLTSEELSELPELSNFLFQSKKQLSIGSFPINVHQIDTTSSKISGHTTPLADVLIKYDSTNEFVTADEFGAFETTLSNTIPDDTIIELIANIPGSFLYSTRKITTPYDGELSIIEATTMFTFSMQPISTNPVILPKNKNLTINVVDSRKTPTIWSLSAYIKNHLTSSLGDVLEDAIIFKKLNNETIILNETPCPIYTNSTNNAEKLTVVTFSQEKGPLLDLSNNYLLANEEYFAKIYFDLKE